MGGDNVVAQFERAFDERKPEFGIIERDSARYTVSVIIGRIYLHGIRAIVTVAREIIQRFLAVERVDAAIIDHAVRLALFPLDALVVGGMAVMPQVVDSRAVIADDVAARFQESSFFKLFDLPIVTEFLLVQPPFRIGLQSVMCAKPAFGRVPRVRNAPVGLRPVIAVNNAVRDEIVA